MSENQFHLMKTRRFLPLFVTFFLGAANDNLFRNAMAILILYRLAGPAGLDGKILVSMAGGIFILPFFLFSALAGELADKYEKSRLIRRVKIAEILIMGMGAAGLVAGDAYFLLAVLFLMGTQSAFFGPVKYAILPSHLREDELIAGNAMMEAGTFLAILLGTIAGGLLILGPNGAAIVGAAVFGVAVAGWRASQSIPTAEPPAPDLVIDRNPARATWRVMRQANATPDIRLAILGISWFWLVGATLLSQFPNLAKFAFNADNEVVTLFLATATVGIATGSFLCNLMLNGEISARFVPLGAFGMTLFLVDLWLASPVPGTLSGPLADAAGFLASPGNWRVLVDILGISVCGGIYTVPLYAILQTRSDPDARSRAIAGNNILNALFMVTGAVATTLLLAESWSVAEVLLAIGIINLGMVPLLRPLR